MNATLAVALLRDFESLEIIMESLKIIALQYAIHINHIQIVAFDNN